MKNLNEDLKNGTFRRVYLFVGEEEYLKQLYRQRITDALVPEVPPINLTIYSGKETDPMELIKKAEEHPFFADWRLIVAENTGFFKSAPDELVNYMGEILETTVLVFIEDDADKRGRLYKAIKKYGRVVEFGRQDERTLTRWILGMVRKEDKQITEGAVRLFLEKEGDDMERILMELEKLFSYTLNRSEITAEDVEAVCSTHIQNRIFDMIRAVADGKQKQAMDMYYDLLALKEPPLRILFLLARNFNQLLQVKELRNAGYDQDAIAGRLGLAPFVVRSLARQAGAFSAEGLRESVGECVELEEAVKTGGMEDRMSVELLLIRLSTRRGQEKS